MSNFRKFSKLFASFVNSSIYYQHYLYNRNLIKIKNETSENFDTCSLKERT